MNAIQCRQETAYKKALRLGTEIIETHFALQLVSRRVITDIPLYPSAVPTLLELAFPKEIKFIRSNTTAFMQLHSDLEEHLSDEDYGILGKMAVTIYAVIDFNEPNTDNIVLFDTGTDPIAG